MAFLHKCFQYTHPDNLFIENWHLDAIAYQLAMAMAGMNNRCIINLPPRSLKSFIVSVVLPAWILGHKPDAKIITIAYSDELSKQHMLLFRQIMASAWYKELFPETAISEWKDTDSELLTTANGYRICVSVGGSITGRGADYIIIDDPNKADDANYPNELARRNEWYSSTIPSRLNNKKTGVIILVMQRLDVADLTAHLLESGDFNILSLPAVNDADRHIPVGDNERHFWPAGALLQPDREDAEVLGQLERSMGPRVYAAQYLQNPVPREGALFKAGYLQRYTADPGPFEHLILSCDPASKTSSNNDYSAVVLLGVKGDKYYVLNVWRQRLELPDLQKLLVRLYAEYAAGALLIEDAGIGIGLLQQIKADAPGVNSIGYKPKLDKKLRAEQATIVAEAGRLFLPEKAQWLPDFERELLQFPSVKHDDQVDALSQAIIWHQSRSEVPSDFTIPIVRSSGEISLDGFLSRLYQPY